MAINMRYHYEDLHKRIEQLETALRDCNRLLDQAWQDKAKAEDAWAELANEAMKREHRK